MCTPFDEDSVEKVVKDNFDILKIASASMDDWPLLETVVKTSFVIITQQFYTSRPNGIKKKTFLQPKKRFFYSRVPNTSTGFFVETNFQ